jgi:hypothetical protein
VDTRTRVCSPTLQAGFVGLQPTGSLPLGGSGDGSAFIASRNVGRAGRARVGRGQIGVLRSRGHPDIMLCAV